MLFSSLGRYAIIFVIIFAAFGGLGIYVWWTNATIQNLNQQVSALNAQAKSLQAANSAMQRDIAQVQQAQSDADQKLTAIRTQSAKMAQNIQRQVVSMNTSNPTALQTQINKDQAATFDSLEALTAIPLPPKAPANGSK